MNSIVEASRFLPLNRKAFNKLANQFDFLCTSIYLPYDEKITNRISKLKSTAERCMEDVSLLLKKKGLENHYVLDYCRDISELIEELPDHQTGAKGLAIFLTKKSVNCILIPFTPEYFIYVNDHFYLKPLAPYINHKCRFMLLAIGHQETRFFRVNGRELQWLWSYRNKHVSGTLHQTEKRYNNFLKELCRHLLLRINNNKERLIVAGNKKIKQYFHFTKAENERQIYEIPFDAVNGVNDKLKEKVFEICFNLKEENKKKSIKKYRLNQGKTDTTDEILDIVLSSTEGKITSLFVNPETDVFGELDRENNYVFINDKHDRSGTSLTNLAAIHTIINGGNVYLLKTNELPGSDSAMKAIMNC